MKIKNLKINPKTSAWICGIALCCSLLGNALQHFVNKDLEQNNEALTSTISDLNTDIEGFNNDISELNNQILVLDDEKESLTEKITFLEGANDELEKANEGLDTQVKDLETQVLELQQQIDRIIKPKKDKSKNNNSIEGLTTIDEDTATRLFYEDGVLCIDSISNPYRLEYYCSPSCIKNNKLIFDLDSGGCFVCEIEKDGINYLVDANDYKKVLAFDYKSIGEPITVARYDAMEGEYGSPLGIGQGMVREVIKTDGTKQLVDANYFEIVLQNYIYYSEPYYLYYYVFYHGGTDTGSAYWDEAGYVFDVKMKDGTKYLVDASNFNEILAVNHEKVYCDGNDEHPRIVVEYSLGKKDVYEASEFEPTISNVLTKGYK